MISLFPTSGLYQTLIHYYSFLTYFRHLSVLGFARNLLLSFPSFMLSSLLPPDHYMYCLSSSVPLQHLYFAVAQN